MSERAWKHTPALPLSRVTRVGGTLPAEPVFCICKMGTELALPFHSTNKGMLGVGAPGYIPIPSRARTDTPARLQEQ